MGGELHLRRSGGRLRVSSVRLWLGMGGDPLPSVAASGLTGQGGEGVAGGFDAAVLGFLEERKAA